MQNYFAHSFRLWISKVFLLDREGNDFFLYGKLVKTVQVQGIIVSFKRLESMFLFCIDDSTGVIECALYLKDLKKITLKIGDLVRITGKINMYHGEISIKLNNPPFVIENFDEDIDWALSLDKLWRCVYTIDQIPKVHNPVDQSALKNEKKNPEEEFEIVKTIRNSGKDLISFKEIAAISKGETEMIVLKFIQEDFLIPCNSVQELSETDFKISNKPYHPIEFLKILFEKTLKPLSFDEIKEMNQGKFYEYGKTLVSSINELMELNMIYEVTDGVYAYIRDDE